MSDNIKTQSLKLDWAYAYGKPTATASIRQSAEDFFVDEILGFEPDNDGQHVMLHIEKRNTNTEWLARQLARHAGVRPVAVGYAGLKDRNAVTRQWFSVDLAGKQEPDWSVLESDEIKVLRAARHRRKLKRGTLRGNCFRLILRDIEGDRAELDRHLHHISIRGVPNYFGEQRFGRDQDNHMQALRMFSGELKVKDRNQRGLYLSAARSYLFNLLLMARIEAGNWDRALDGEVFILDSRHSMFWGEPLTKEIIGRLKRGEIHLTGPLWGRGEAHTSGDAAQLETQCLQPYAEFKDGLERAGMKMERRALRLMAREMAWRWQDDATLRLSFCLTSGAYATSVLRELVITR